MSHDKGQVMETRISIHAISRLNERMFGNMHLHGLSDDEVERSNKLMIKMLDESYPCHEKIKNATFIFKDYGINMLKINNVIVTVRLIEEDENGFKIEEHKIEMKTKRKENNERKTYIRGEYRVRDGINRQRVREIQRRSNTEI